MFGNYKKYLKGSKSYPNGDAIFGHFDPDNKFRATKYAMEIINNQVSFKFYEYGKVVKG